MPLAYRADVQQVFRHAPRHAIYTSHMRFADAAELRFAPGAPYGGLHLVPGFRLQIAGHGSDIRGDMFPIPCDLAAQHDAPLQFAVSDDFYWNRREPQPLELRVTYEDRGAGSFWLEYDAWRDPFQRSAPVALSGDGATQTATFQPRRRAAWQQPGLVRLPPGAHAGHGDRHQRAGAAEMLAAFVVVSCPLQRTTDHGQLTLLFSVLAI